MKRHRKRPFVLAVAALATLAPAANAVAQPDARPSPPQRSQASSRSVTAAIAVSPGSDHRAVLWPAAHGQIEEAFYTSSWHGPSGHRWRSVTGLSAGLDAAGHRYVFWTGPRGHIYTAYRSARWHAPHDLTSTQGWGRTGTTVSAPALAVNPANGHQDIFWRAPSGRIYESWYAGRWHRPVDRGWRSRSAPSAAVNRAGHEYVAWLGSSGHIFEASYAGHWGPAQDLTATLHWSRAGTSASRPAVAVNPGNDQQYLYWLAPDGRIYEAWNARGWRGPVTRGWRAAGAPSAAANALGDQHIVWSASGQIWEGFYRDGGWSGPVARWHINPGPGQYVEAVQTTADLGQRMTPVSNLRFSSASPGRLPVIAVNDRARYQHMTGVGAAMTDTSAWLLGEQISPAIRTSLMADLFTTRGIHLAFTLIPMGGSDFTVSGLPYSYDDLPANQSDPSLARFSVAHDLAYVLPVLRQMLAIAPHEKTFAVPWSPPGWMKANGSLDDRHHQGTLLPKAYGPLAAYFVRFLQAYAQQGVPISAVAPENEPRAASAFPALNFPEVSEARWLTANLKPALALAGLHPLVYGSDTSWSSGTYARALALSAARSGLDGLAWHCYGGAPTVMSALHHAAPQLDQVVTECAPNLSLFAVPEILIGSLRNWASAVTLWNVALDPAKGPVQAPNTGCHGCHGLLVIDERTHQVRRNLSYYQLGQVGSFVETGARRISSNNFVTYRVVRKHAVGVTAGIDDVAALNPDGSRVLVVYNNSAGRVRFAVRWDGRSFPYSLAPAATVTFRWNA